MRISFPSVRATRVTVKKVMGLRQQLNQRDGQKIILHIPRVMHHSKDGALFLKNSVPIPLVVRKSLLFGLK